MKDIEAIGNFAQNTIPKSPFFEELAGRIGAELFVFELDTVYPFRFIDGAYESYQVYL